MKISAKLVAAPAATFSVAVAVATGVSSRKITTELTDTPAYPCDAA